MPIKMLRMAYFCLSFSKICELCVLFLYNNTLGQISINKQSKSWKPTTVGHIKSHLKVLRFQWAVIFWQESCEEKPPHSSSRFDMLLNTASEKEKTHRSQWGTADKASSDSQSWRPWKGKEVGFHFSSRFSFVHQSALNQTHLSVDVLLYEGNTFTDFKTFK